MAAELACGHRRAAKTQLEARLLLGLSDRSASVRSLVPARLLAPALLVVAVAPSMTRDV